MGKFRLACHLIQFRGEQHENPEKVLAEVAEAGWDGVEGLKIDSGDDLVAKANLARKNGLHLVNVGGPSPLDRVRYNIALGNDAAEVPSCRRAMWGAMIRAMKMLKMRRVRSMRCWHIARRTM